MGISQVVATATAWSDLTCDHFRDLTKMVCAVWWYQKFAYLCSVDECTLLHCPPIWVLNLNELMLSDVRDYLRNLATSNKGGEV